MIQRAKLAATKQRIKAFGEKPKVLPTPALTAPHDRQGWYRKLNVTPTGACLDPAQSVMITNHIKAQFYNLSQQLHPDRTRGVSDGAGQRSLNDAWAHLQTGQEI